MSAPMGTGGRGRRPVSGIVASAGAKVLPPGSALLALAVMAAALLACSDDPTDPFALAPCRDLPPVELSTAPALTLDDLAPALRDAAERLAGALPAGELRDDLRSTVRQLSTAPRSRDTACRLFLLSRESLERLEREPEPALKPDCDAIHLVLDLTVAALAREES